MFDVPPIFVPIPIRDVIGKNANTRKNYMIVINAYKRIKYAWKRKEEQTCEGTREIEQ